MCGWSCERQCASAWFAHVTGTTRPCPYVAVLHSSAKRRGVWLVETCFVLPTCSRGPTHCDSAAAVTTLVGLHEGQAGTAQRAQQHAAWQPAGEGGAAVAEVKSTQQR